MAIVKKGTWINDDGLAIDFGLDEAQLAQVAEYREDGPKRCIEVTVYDISKFNATDDYVLDSKISLPKGAIVTQALVGPSITNYASSGGGTVSVGLIDKDQTNNLASTALINTASVSELNAGEQSSAVGTAPGDGTVITSGGTALTAAKFLTLSVDTAVFQSGSGTFRIWYEVPKPQADGLVWDKS